MIIILGMMYTTAMANINKDKPESDKTSQEQGGSVAPPPEQDMRIWHSGLKSAQVDYGSAPYYNWVKQFGGTGLDLAEDIATDSTGNVYLTGYFNGTIKVGNKNIESVGDRDGIVAKFDKDGNLVWINQLRSGPGTRISPFSIQIDAAGNSYITGGHFGDVSIGGNSLTGSGNGSLLIAKLDSDGQIVFAAGHPSINEDENGHDIDLDAMGNIYVLGAVSTSANNTSYPSLIIKYSPTGTILWEQEHDEAFSAMELENGSLYFAGTLRSNFGDRSGQVDGILDSNVVMIHPWSYADVFLAKADLTGDFLWASIAEHSDSAGDSYSADLLVDSDENIYMTGNYRNEILFGSDILYGNNNFLAKCSSDGQYIWGKDLPNLSSVALDSANMVLASLGGGVIRLDTLDGNWGFVDTVSYTPRAIATFISKATPSENARYYTGIDLGSITLSKVDQSFDPVWDVNMEGNSASGEIHGMVTDDMGNLYTYGEAGPKVDFFGKRLEGGIFLSKQNSSGEVLWIKEIPGLNLNTGNDNLLAIDRNNQFLYFTGDFHGTLDIGGDVQLTGPEFWNDVFVAKYGVDGSYQWAKKYDFYGHELCLAPDNSGNVLLSGVFNDTINIGGTELIGTNFSEDVFLTKINSAGTPTWAISAGGDGVEYMGYVSTDASDNIYLTGEFTSMDITVGSTPFTMNDGDGNVFFSKLDPNGNVLWIKPKAAGITVPGRDNSCWPTGFRTDAAGNSYIKGWHGDSVYFDSVLLTSPHGPYGFFIAKFDTDGNTLWANSIDEKQWAFDYNTMDIDDAGSVYMGAQVKDTIWFGSDFVLEHSGSRDLFVVKYNTDGELGWVKTIGGNFATSNISSIAVTDSSRVYVGGDFNGYASFDGLELTSKISHGFITMLTSATLPGITYTKKDVTTTGGNDGSIDVTVTGGKAPYSYEWSNGAKTQDIATLVAGDYALTVADSDSSLISSSITIDEPLDTTCYISPEFEVMSADLVVNFSNFTTGTNNNYSWSFGDGYLSNLFEPSHTYSKAGVYDICLTVYDSISGCMEEICQNVEVGTVVCISDFNFYHDADIQSMVHFTSSVSGPVESYYWMFGDGYISTLPDPSHTYGVPGYYNVSLTVIDSSGNCIDQALENIKVGGVECNADFSYYIDSLTNTAYFTSKDLNDNSVYYWIFGDGSQSTLKDPSRAFMYPGFYKISLSVYEDVSGCLDNKEKIILVGGGEDVEADFIYQAQTVGTSVSFQDLSLGKNLTYFWDFGDGNNSTTANPVHDYVLGGYYNVCLNAYSASGLQNITCKMVFVGSDVNQDCLGRFAYLVDNATKTVTYTDKSFGVPDVWSWNFGDGKSSIMQSPENVYAESGYYTTQLTIENSASNCKDHAFKLINVDEVGGLVAGFGYLVDSSDKKADTYPVDFVGVSLGDAGKLKWDFGDGTTDTTSLSRTHSYSAPGTYEVCLYMSDPNTGQADTICQTISVSASGNVGITGIEAGGLSLTSYPNPFKEHSTVAFELQGQTLVDLALYDLMGRKVQQLLREERESGRHQLDLDGTHFESGHYYLLLRTPDAVERTTITIAR